MTRRVLIVGGGYAGMTAARRLRRKAPRDVEITLVNPHGYMTYQPLLAETAGGTVSPQHVIVPLRRNLPGVQLRIATLIGVDSASKVAKLESEAGSVFEVEYDELVLAVGSVTRTFPVPGLAEHAIGFRTVEEALYLRNRVLWRLESAAVVDDVDLRKKLLTFGFVGAGYA